MDLLTSGMFQGTDKCSCTSYDIGLGHHPEFLEQLQLIERKRQERSQVIQTWRDREIECINTEHDAELMHAENEFNVLSDIPGLRNIFVLIPFRWRSVSCEIE